MLGTSDRLVNTGGKHLGSLQGLAQGPTGIRLPHLNLPPVQEEEGSRLTGTRTVRDAQVRGRDGTPNSYSASRTEPGTLATSGLRQSSQK